MAEKPQRPNIVIILPDTLRADCISLGGSVNSELETPNIDQLAKEGVAFVNCFSVNPVCAPSRCCTFTGQYVHSNGHRGLYQLLQPHEENLFKILKDNGYSVFWAGRNDLFDKESIIKSITHRIKFKIPIPKSNPFPKGHHLRKSFYYGKSNKEQAKDFDHVLVNETLKFLDSEFENPFCLFVSLASPHPPYYVEDPYFSLYDRAKIHNPIPTKLEDKPQFMRLMQERYGLKNLTLNEFKEIRATYYGMITRVDYHIGEILKKLKEIGEYEQSAIFITSDHGDYTGDYGLTEKWPNAFQDCLIKVPLIIKAPGIDKKDKLFTQLVQTIDLFPTILDIAQIELSFPYTHYGKNLMPIIKGNQTKFRDAVFAEGGYSFNEPQCFELIIKDPDQPWLGIYYDKTNIPQEYPETVARSVMIRTEFWKLIHRDAGKEELYDLINDPQEIINLFENVSYREIKFDLEEKLLRWYLQTSDSPHWKKERLI